MIIKMIYKKNNNNKNNMVNDKDNKDKGFSSSVAIPSHLLTLTFKTSHISRLDTLKDAVSSIPTLNPTP